MHFIVQHRVPLQVAADNLDPNVCDLQICDVFCINRSGLNLPAKDQDHRAAL